MLTEYSILTCKDTVDIFLKFLTACFVWVLIDEIIQNRSMGDQFDVGSVHCTALICSRTFEALFAVDFI